MEKMDNMEKLIVEFEVEKEVWNKYGIQEKYLLHNKKRIPYKAIVRDDNLLAIVSRKYKLIPNEDVIKIVAKWCDDHDLLYKIFSTDTRVHILCSKDGKGIIVHNSIDATFALRVDLLHKVKDGYAIFRMPNLQTVYRRHTKNILEIVAALPRMLTEIYSRTKEYESWLKKLETKMLTDDFVQSLRDEGLPKKLLKGIVLMNLYRTRPTLRDVYEIISARIWNADVDMRTKCQYFKILNDLMLIEVEWSDIT